MIHQLVPPGVLWVVVAGELSVGMMCKIVPFLTCTQDGVAQSKAL